MNNSSNNFQLAFIQLLGLPERERLTKLIKFGIELLQYHPKNLYLCWAKTEDFNRTLQLPFIREVIELTPKLKPQVQIPLNTAQPIWLIIFRLEMDFLELATELNNIPGVGVPLDQQIDVCRFYLRVKATITARGQQELLLQHYILGIESYHLATAKDEVSALVIAGQYSKDNIVVQCSYLEWLKKHNLSGKGVAVSVVDAGIYAKHPAFNNRVKDLTEGKQSWHGTFVAGHVAGCYLEEKDKQGFIYGLGLAPGAELLAQNKNMPITFTCNQTVNNIGVNGSPCTIQNNSWGLGTSNSMNYSSLESTFDLMVRNANYPSLDSKPLTICFSAGNEGTRGLCRPCAAKNIIVTGNSKNYRPKAVGNEANNINDVFNGEYATGKNPSSHGNCGDGRIRPHIVAPGQYTASASYGLHIDRDHKRYISQLLTWSHGTSAASAHTAGACALLTEWWRKNHNGKDPSPAMLKALIVNAAVDTGFGGHIPNNRQGWGRLNIGNIIESETKNIYLDQETMFTHSNEKKTWQVKIDNPTKPVKITLAWTDPPGGFNTGIETTTAIVNKLVLKVLVDGKIYQGNNFQTGWSISGEPKKQCDDNLQNVFLLPDLVTNTIEISLIALELWMNCLSGTVYPPQQDFALVVSNGCLERH